MYEIIEVRYTGSYIVGSNTLQAVLGTFVATTASDLPSQNADCHIICGSNGLDISTGDKYIWDGYAWIKQPNAGRFYTISYPRIGYLIIFRKFHGEIYRVFTLTDLVI